MNPSWRRSPLFSVATVFRTIDRGRSRNTQYILALALLGALLPAAPAAAQEPVRPAVPADGAASPLKAAVAAAAHELAAQSGFRWETTTRGEGGGPSGGGGSTTSGQHERDGYTFVASTGPPASLEFARRGGQAAVVMEGSWMTLDQAAARSTGGGGRLGGGGFRRESITGFQPPHAQVEALLGKATGFREEGSSIIAELGMDAVNEILGSGRPRGGRGGGPGGRPGPGGGFGAPLRDATGAVTFTIQGGMLTGFTITASGLRESRGGQERRSRTTTTTFTEIGSTRVSLPADAREILEALAAGRAPRVFVPEPGFRKLFNGHDLSGWSGRPGHWSVEEGAITGRTTKETPAPGNTFLIARSGDRNLIVDDFELRFSYRVVADNSSGFANSGVQYRSKDLGGFVVAGYQADFEAGETFSGILYDEGGGAGGRGILAGRGQLVAWSPGGKKSVTGHLGRSEDIQTKIKANDWNDYVIIAQGSRLRHFINGVQTVGVVDEAEGQQLASGVLALQLHAGEPMTVQVKDIRIKSLGTPDMVGGANIKVAKGFKIEMLYTVPRETEGSWVALCVDPRGRLIAGDQNGSLYRLALPAAGGEGLRTERIDLDIGEAHGLLHAFGSLYVAVNEGGRPHGVYRVRDTDGDDRYDQVELLRRVQAGGEHGLHSLVLAPDGKSIHVVIGNQSSLTEMASSRVPYNWSEDDLLPRLPTGFMDDSYAPQGYISSMDPDGKTWELVAVGLRNPYDIAFNRAGELFTYDADMEWDIGAPWYRPTRVNHVVSGAEFGFRNGNGKWPDHCLDSFGAVVDIGPGSPTGIAFGHGAKFPAKYQDALYIADWSFGKLRAVHLQPDGASYTAEVEDFASGQPFPVTDLVINPSDGAMYIAVGGRGAQSALYRVTYRGEESTAPSVADTKFQDRRDLRRRLESFHGRQDPAAVEAVWQYLGDPDRAIRFAARVALEWQDVTAWRARALAEKDTRRAIAALIALARASGRDAVHRRDRDPPPGAALSAEQLAKQRTELLAKLDAIALPELGPADRLDLLRAYWLTFTRLGPPDDAARATLAARLEPLFPGKSRDGNRMLAQLLVYLEAPGAARKVVAALREAPTQEEQIEYAVALRALKTGWTQPLREEYFRWFVKAQGYRGGNTFAGSLRRAKENAVALLGDAERTALQPILEAQAERRSPQEILAARPVVKEWKLDDLLPLAERGLEGGRSFERGRRLYGEVACAACHRFADGGGSVGPDLSGVAGRFGVKDLLEAIVAPSKTISDQYEAVVILKKDGQAVIGRIGNLGGSSVNVIENMLDPGAMTSVRRSDIVSIESSRVSPMPEGLLDTLQEEEIQDLLAYLLSRGDPEAPLFR